MQRLAGIAMHGILLPPQNRPSQETPPHGEDLEAVTLSFLQQAQRSARARFAGDPRWARGCHTAQVAVPPDAHGAGCSGSIVAHVSPALVHDWAAIGTGSLRDRKAHVLRQLQLVLQDLSDHDMHGYLSLTDAQCDIYGQDLVQLVTEALARTSFPALRRECHVHWEGTLVRSLRPPVFVLVLSIAA